MSRARDLTMGPRRRRAPIGTTGPYAVARRLYRRPTLTPAELVELKDAVAQIMATPRRLRFAEGAVLNDACSAYFRLTGDRIGPMTGTY